MLSLKKGEDEFGYLDLLLAIYRFEAKRVAGPGSYRRDIRDTLWSVKEFLESSNHENVSSRDMNTLLRRMEKSRELMVVTTEENGEKRYTTKVAESIRVLGHTYEYWYRGRPGVDALRWVVEERKVPERSIPALEFISKVQEGINDALGSRNHRNLADVIETVVKGISRHLMKANINDETKWKEANFSDFQLVSTIEMLKAQYIENYEKQNQILTAGVGSGKTIAFLVAVFVSALESIRNGMDIDSRTHLLLYPRTALALDQFDTIQQMAQCIHDGISVLFDHTSYYKKLGLTVKKGIKREYGRRYPPNIIVTTLETLKRRLQNPIVVKKIGRQIVRVVLDEIHLVQGLTGSHVIRLIRRLRAINGSTNIFWTGSSATVAAPDNHASMVFGVKRKHVRVILPLKENLITHGIVNHVFLKPSPLMSPMGTLVNATSLLVHGRRPNLYKLHNSRNPSRNPKTIGFADNLDLLGRWNADLRENERTESALDRRHPEEQDINNWEPREREIPYALRYLQPLTRRILATKGVSNFEEDEFSEILDELKDINPCQLCKAGMRFSPTKCSAEEMNELGRFVQRHPTKTTDPAKRFNIMNSIFRKEAIINTMEQCPYLQAGACIWFSDDDFSIEKIKGTRMYEYRCVVHSRIYSSKTKGHDVELEVEDLSSTVFQGSTHEVYDAWSRGEVQNVPCDLVLSSPSLEVGIDLANVTESIMFKATRNVASYRQKTGRAGRESGSITLCITLVSPTPIDFHYYRQPRKLTHLAQLEPVPLEDKNISIMFSALYCAVWDFLATRHGLTVPEMIPLDGLFGPSLLKCIKELKRNRQYASKHLARVSGGRYSEVSKEVQDAIDVVLNELAFLTSSVHGIFGRDIKTLADVVTSYISSHMRRAQLKGDLGQAVEVIDSGSGLYWESRPFISPIEFGLAKEFQELDMMMDSEGWDESKMAQLLNALESKQTQENQNRFASRHLGRIIEALKDILLGISELSKNGIDARFVSFFNQFIDLYNSQKYRTYYLSFLLQELRVFRLFRSNPSYISPQNLFTNPYDYDVFVDFKRPGGGESEWVSLTEALFSFIPGTWTFRWGVRPFKTLVGELDHKAGGQLIAEFDKMMGSGNNTFVPEKMNERLPLGSGDDEIDIYRPVRLTARQSNKYQQCRPSTGIVVDKDEGKPGSSERTDKVKIPRSYLARWVSVKASKGENILCHDIGSENFFLQKEGKTVKGEKIRQEIKHPMQGGLISNLYWHENLDAVDFVYSTLRSYSKPKIGGRNITYMKKGRRVGFGRNFSTNGVSIELNPQTFRETLNEITDTAMSGNKLWIPTMLKALSANLIELGLEENSNLNRFMIRDLIATLVVSVYPNLDELETGRLVSQIRNLLENESLFKESAYRYYATMGLDESKIQDIDEPESLDDKDITERVNRLIASTSNLDSALPDLEESLRKRLEIWVERTLLNTFGSAAVTALQKISGVTGTEVGYTFSIDDEGSKYKLYLFDWNHHGNGSSRVMKDFFHILHVQRYSTRRLDHRLPTYDYATLLEEELLQCSQFLQDMNALKMIENLGKSERYEGHPELEYLDDYSKEIVRVSKEVWNTVGISDRGDAWKLPLLNMIAGYVASKNPEIEGDDVVRATAICWNGCPECSDTRGGAMGAIGGDSFMDKAVLDLWFSIGRRKTSEYKTTQLSELKGKTSTISIGEKSYLGIEHEDGTRLRSVSLPHTIGLEIDRKHANSNVNIVIRDNDIVGQSIGKSAERTSWHGIPAQAFRRLIWYNLLTTSFLDSMGILEDSEKEVWLVYFNVRDLDFVDVGMSGRAMEILEYYHDKDATEGPIERLSDLLIWLAGRGFKISVCTDHKQVTKEGNRRDYKKVEKLLTRLSKGGVGVFTKDFPKGSGIMHKKGMKTQIGLVSGSANLTVGGSTYNEEDLSYFLPADLGYQDMILSLNDTLSTATRWKPKS